ncbi:hypothetical protein SLS53_008727 [Cytospora paraplurivora]|uniref:Uncharacterized protein n=1 Tax=Cytospora paraplurivora TaxID=2898453 RepID=A0AAN9TYC5_9PEZI
MAPRTRRQASLHTSSVNKSGSGSGSGSGSSSAIPVTPPFGRSQRGRCPRRPRVVGTNKPGRRTQKLASAPAGFPGRRVHLGSATANVPKKILSTVLRLQVQNDHVVYEPSPGTEALAVTLGLPSPVCFSVYLHTLIHTSERARHRLRRWAGLRTANGRGENNTFNFQSSGMYELALEARRKRLGEAPSAKPIFARKKVDDIGAFQPRDLYEAIKADPSIAHPPLDAAEAADTAEVAAVVVDDGTQSDPDRENPSESEHPQGEPYNQSGSRPQSEHLGEEPPVHNGEASNVQDELYHLQGGGSGLPLYTPKGLESLSVSRFSEQVRPSTPRVSRANSEMSSYILGRASHVQHDLASAHIVPPIFPVVPGAPRSEDRMPELSRGPQEDLSMSISMDLIEDDIYDATPKRAQTSPETRYVSSRAAMLDNIKEALRATGRADILAKEALEANIKTTDALQRDLACIHAVVCQLVERGSGQPAILAKRAAALDKDIMDRQAIVSTIKAFSVQTPDSNRAVQMLTNDIAPIRGLRKELQSRAKRIEHFASAVRKVDMTAVFGILQAFKAACKSDLEALANMPISSVLL